MEHARPRALLLDVMGTLVHDPFYAEIPAHFGMSLEALVKVVHPTSWIEFERGLLDEAQYLERFFKDCRAIDRDALRGDLRRAYRWIEGIEELLGELGRRGVPMYALSNYSTWYEIIEEVLGLSRFLSWDFVSCKTGVRKPDQEAFVGAARRLGLPPGECLFVDDRAINVRAAEKIGMPSLQFTGAPALRAALIERGLL